MEKRNKLRLLDNKNNVICFIDCITYYDDSNEFDEGETFYINPINGNECETIKQCFYNWSELNFEDNENWNKLINLIEKDLELSIKIFNYDNIDYYIN